MARRKLALTKAGISLAAGVAKTVMQVKAINVPLVLASLSVGFQGTNNTDAAVLVELVRQTNGGTMTSLTPRLKDNGITYTPNMTAQHTATVEPTDSGVVLDSQTIHPQTSAKYPFSDNAETIVDAGTWLGIRLTAAANVTCVPSLEVEE